MKTIRCIFFCIVLLSLLPLGNALAGVDAYHDRGTFTVDETFWNECTGEEVHLTGTMMWFSHGMVTSSGIMQWGFQARYQGVKGIGLTSGTIYQANSGEHGYGTTVIENAILPYHYAAGGTYTTRLIAKGNQPDLVIRNRVRVTVTPDFIYRVEIYDFEAVCR